MKRHSACSAMRVVFWFALSVLLAALSACSRTTTPGNPLELSGTIADWLGGTGTVQVEISLGQFLLEAPVDGEGRFDITLPATLPEEKLVDFETIKSSFCGKELNSSTEDFKINGVGPLGVTRDGIRRGQVYQSSAKLPNGPAPVGTVIVLRFYVTKDVHLGGSCAMEFALDLNLKTG